MKLLDLQSQYAARSQDFEAALLRVARSGQFLDGPEVAAFEAQLEAFLAGPGCATCASGSDALVLALCVLGVQPGDEVIVPAFTFAATAEAVVHLGAVPVFADVDACGLLSRETVGPCLSPRTKAVVFVSLFGQVPPLEILGPWLDAQGIAWLEDAAQSFGATRGERLSGTFGLATTSFFPGKPLGGWGKGGAVFSADPLQIARLKALRNHGQLERGIHDEVGWNSRLDEIQAAVLRIKLEMFPEELRRRRELADLYRQALPASARLLELEPGCTGSCSQLVVRVSDREVVLERLRASGIPFGVHYPRPLQLQPAFLPWKPARSLPMAEALSGEVISLPLHPWLSEGDVETVCRVLGEG